jgi:hypothetical protein
MPPLLRDMTDDAPQPTLQDLDNAARRQAIADRQNEEFREVQLLALSALGPGYTGLPHEKWSRS